MVRAVRVARVFQLKTVADVNDCRGTSPLFDERISSIKNFYIQHDITEWSITMINCWRQHENDKNKNQNYFYF